MEVGAFQFLPATAMQKAGKVELSNVADSRRILCQHVEVTHVETDL